MSDLALEISCSEVARRLAEEEGILLIDCREPEEHNHVSILGSTLRPMNEILQGSFDWLEEENRDIIVYCHHGIRSARVAVALRQQGAPRAFSLAGGIDLWATEIDPGMKRY